MLLEDEEEEEEEEENDDKSDGNQVINYSLDKKGKKRKEFVELLAPISFGFLCISSKQLGKWPT